MYTPRNNDELIRVITKQGKLLKVKGTLRRTKENLNSLSN